MNNFLEIERSEEPLLNKIQDDLHLKSKEVKDSFEFLKEMELYYTEEELKIFADKIGKYVYIFEIEYKPKRIKWL